VASLLRDYAYTRNGRAARHGGMFVLSGTPIAQERPNRRAAGAQATLERQKRRMGLSAVKTGDATRIAVQGTLDVLAFGMMFKTARKDCTCCGSRHGKIMLNDSGRARLKALRRMRQKRKEN
jgi:hypothetical protein